MHAWKRRRLSSKRLAVAVELFTQEAAVATSNETDSLISIQKAQVKVMWFRA